MNLTAKILEENKKNKMYGENIIGVNNEYRKLSIAIDTIRFYCNSQDASKCNAGLCKMHRSYNDCYLEEIFDYLHNLRDEISNIRFYNEILSTNID